MSENPTFDRITKQTGFNPDTCRESWDRLQSERAAKLTKWATDVESMIQSWKTGQSPKSHTRKTKKS